MIYTVTLNPSIDYVAHVKELTLGAVNRTNYERMLPGGKGINVSMVLKNLGIANTALGFTAGFTGLALEHMLAEQGVSCDFIHVADGNSRINFKLQTDGQKGETEVNGMGPNITEQDVEQLYRRFAKLQQDDILVLAGTIPSSLPNAMYMNIIRLLEGRGVKVVVDATNEQLKSVLPYHPFLIKPNVHELGELFGVEIKNKADAFMYARRLQEQGARNVLVSMGSQGAVLVTDSGEDISGKAPGGEPIYTVGAGDSMVAGFLAGYLSMGNYDDALAMGLCAGSASACSRHLATQADVDAMMAEYMGLNS